ncbi:SGNH/GDSL hydrolase family protein [Agromyces bracchium]|uniref:SGNH hydrolase-type esterase domain-containing protein n=1 Tax=Agromyces bracchium TaxID=88376 RepID=A0A6I3M5I4_9MICO|nr:SGNH/GDSL hydrolase family protein [Agromyces bracchium]MTH67387.1 hypothetical protein [Agromyces bracchium]
MLGAASYGAGGRRAGTRRAALTVVVAACVSAMAGCSAPGGPDRTPEPEASALALGTFAAVGDSITDADSRDFASGDLGPASWATYVVDEGYVFAGGWAEWGATTERMAAAVAPVDADVLVLLAGTNDLAFGVPFEATTANLDRVVDRVGIDDVLVVSIPPMDAYPGGAEEFNGRLDALADDRGWRFVDASTGLRTRDGRFADGMSTDGLHPSAEGAEVLGEAIAAQLREG